MLLVPPQPALSLTTSMEKLLTDFLGFTSERRQVNTSKLTDHVKLYKKTILLIDEFSMLGQPTLESISSALIQVTGQNMVFGGMAVVFFDDLGQLLPESS